MKHKQIKIQLKEVTAEGTFEGYAAVFGNVDLGGDIIERGAFSKTIQENPTVPVLWGHSPREVIGVNQAWSEDSKGLNVKGKLILDVQRAKEAHALMKEGAVKGLSIGYDPIVVDYSRENEGIRILKEVKLWEYSLTPFPMNPEAQVTGVKTAEDLSTALHELLVLCKRDHSQLSPESKAMIDQAIKQLSALQAAHAPEAAKQDTLAPVLHAMSEQFEFLKS